MYKIVSALTIRIIGTLLYIVWLLCRNECFDCTILSPRIDPVLEVESDQATSKTTLVASTVSVQWVISSYVEFKGLYMQKERKV